MTDFDPDKQLVFWTEEERQRQREDDTLWGMVFGIVGTIILGMAAIYAYVHWPVGLLD